MFEDIIGGAGGALGNISFSVISILGLLHIPLLVMWFIISFVGLYFLWMRNITIVFPWQWFWNVVVAKPLADESVTLWGDKGSYCKQLGLDRFKLQREGFVMQRMDTKDIYPNYEIIAISLAPSKVFYGRKSFDFENNRMILSIGNPKVASLNYIDHLATKDPDYLSRHMQMISILFMYWVILTIAVTISSFTIFYPAFLKIIGAPYGGLA